MSAPPRLGFLLAAAVLAPAAAAGSGVTVRDEWETAGRVAVEVAGRRVVFGRGHGEVIIERGDGAAGREVARAVPLDATGTEPGALETCRVARDGDRVSIETAFTATGNRLAAVFGFGEEGDLEVRPGGGLATLAVRAGIAYGVLPGVVPDDVVYDPSEFTGTGVHVPAEHVFACLLRGERDLVALAWPAGNQKVRLVRAAGRRGAAGFGAVELDLDGRPAWLNVMTAPGIWHREPLLPSFAERDVTLGWRRPFTARWKTQLLETGVRTTFHFLDRPASMWRPDTGSFRYPVRFAGDRAVLHLGKKLPPEGPAFIYAMDGHRDTPLELMRRASGETAAILAGFQERKAYAPPPRRPVNVGCEHCWGSALVKRTLYRFGMQRRERAFLDEHTDNYVDLTTINQTRHQQYLDFIAVMQGRLAEWSRREASRPAVGAFLERMQSCLARLEEKVREALEGAAPAVYIREAEALGDAVKALGRDEGTEGYPEICHLVERLNSVSAGMHEDVSKWFGTCVREWFQEAARRCAGSPETVPYAEAIRSAIRDSLKVRSYEVVEND